MTSKNYELYRKHKADIFNMIYDTWERSPKPPTLFPEWATEEETEQYEKELKEFSKQEKPKIYQQLKDLGFDLKSTN